ncbi:hypothetical protein [Hyphomonas sp.]|jgi:proline iminopeptidase|uniref:hypothetical protein n=1 Tax=Hyphomonas sp. TaxID=87 RepID=UPI0039E624B5
MRNYLSIAMLALAVAGCSPQKPPESPAANTPEIAAAAATEITDEAGVRMIPITTPKGDFKVWTKKVADNPRIKVLLLHGGPGATYESFKPFEDHFPHAGIEFFYYDQLDSYLSDQPNDPDLWTIAAALSEVDQVREALGLDADNFYLYGQYPGLYRLFEKCPSAANGPGCAERDPWLRGRRDFENPRYMELLMNTYYTQHILRRPVDQWPPEVMTMFEHLDGAK